ncbi:hypothetical protein A6A04_04675 [Paramagnetospirillum marisnigri]|uniref:Uncharacterized protein n=1 Tax=Paramagnetospirillum marisnigri TaxID=1285242 RepID=A0A178MHB3_9PROT|nr:hypothetical protein A6A04_04675 [Paramagnetospirillum marisnigri]
MLNLNLSNNIECFFGFVFGLGETTLAYPVHIFSSFCRYIDGCSFIVPTQPSSINNSYSIMPDFIDQRDIINK